MIQFPCLSIFVSFFSSKKKQQQNAHRISRKTERAKIKSSSRIKKKKEETEEKEFWEVDLHHGTALWRAVYNAIVMLLLCYIYRELCDRGY